MANIIHFMKITNHEIQENEFDKLYHCIISGNDDICISEYDLEQFNEFIVNEDVDSAFNLFVNIKGIVNDIKRDEIYSNVDSVWKFVVDDISERWKAEIDNEKFISNLDVYERLCFKFYIFDCQLKNGGLNLWDSNGYSDDLDDIYNFVSNSNFEYKDKFLDVLNNFKEIKDSVASLSKDDVFYDLDYETRIRLLEDFDKQYFKIENNWLVYFEDYLVSNITDKYTKKILGLSVSQPKI